MKDTIDIARKAGFWQEHTNTYMCSTDAIKAFEAFVRADDRSVEREACAKLCEEIAEESDSFTRDILRRTANAIRARGNT